MKMTTKTLEHVMLDDMWCIMISTMEDGVMIDRQFFTDFSDAFAYMVS